MSYAGLQTLSMRRLRRLTALRITRACGCRYGLTVPHPPHRFYTFLRDSHCASPTPSPRSTPGARRHLHQVRGRPRDDVADRDRDVRVPRATRSLCGLCRLSAPWRSLRVAVERGKGVHRLLSRCNVATLYASHCTCNRHSSGFRRSPLMMRANLPLRSLSPCQLRRRTLRRTRMSPTRSSSSPLVLRRRIRSLPVHTRTRPQLTRTTMGGRRPLRLLRAPLNKTVRRWRQPAPLRTCRRAQVRPADNVMTADTLETRWARAS
jgi:hypothetical protein